MKLKRIVAGVVPFLFVGCANLSLNDVYQNPQFEYQATRISDVNFDSLAGVSSVKINNRNPYQLPISALNGQLWLEGKPWLNIDNAALSGLPAQSAVSVDLQWGLIFDELLTRAANVYQAGAAEFTLKLSPTVQVPVLGPQALNWESTFTVPVPKVPKVSLADWSVKKISFSQISLALSLAVENPNAFGINTQGWQLDVGDGANSLAQLNLKDAALASSATSLQEVELTLSLADVGLAMVSAIKAGQWPESLGLDWQGQWSSPDLGFALPDIAGKLR